MEMKLLLEIFDFIHMMGGQIINFRHCEAAGPRYQVFLQA